MSGSQDTGVLHVTLQVPKLLQADAANVDDVCGGDNGGLGIGARQTGAQGHDEVEEVLIEGEKAEQALRDLGRLVRFRGGGGIGHGGVVSRHVLAVQVFDLKHIDGDTAAVSAARPLGVLGSALA